LKNGPIPNLGIALNIHFFKSQICLVRQSLYGIFPSNKTVILVIVCTAKKQYRKFETNIPRKGIARPQFQFPHSCVCEQFIYSQDRSAYSAAGKYVDRTWEYINRTHIHECGNWDRGREITRKEIHKWDFHCSVVGEGWGADLEISVSALIL
jgi:hypothetical protein